MMDYIPSGDAELRAWSKNLLTEGASANEILQLPAEQVALVNAALNTMTEKMDISDVAVAAATKAMGDKKAAKQAARQAGRAFAKQAKASPYYTDEIGKRLRIYVASVSKNLVDYKPEISVKETGGHVHISFTKNGVHGLNIYTLLPGATAWTLLGTGIQSPYIDTRPPAQAGVAELRQYKAMGIEKNIEVGQWSEIVSISFSG